jgi:hypothetical protein
MANRAAAAAALAQGSTSTAAATGTPGARGANTQLRGLSSISRNRLGLPEAEYDYPNIHADPATLYRERFGLDEPSDCFVLPWVMNLIFEDRWLLAEKDPTVAVQNQIRRRLKVDIRDPDPDTANFPNGAYTVPKGRMYIENSPVSFYGPSAISLPQYNWEFLYRYGMTDNLEFRIFSNGLTATKGKGGTTGFSPLAFDFKANFWEENSRYWIPAMGLEVYLQTALGSPAFDVGTQPSMNLLFDQTLPFNINLEQNFGITGMQGPFRLNFYEFSYQWSLQRQVVKDLDIFYQGFYNAAALPRLPQFTLREALRTHTRRPKALVMGGGAIWTVNSRLAIFGSYNVGLTEFSPTTIALLGFAIAL